MIPSFGGYSADHGGTEIADSCTNVSSIAADYEQVITTLGVTRLDMDVESSSLNNTAGIDRRNQAIALTEQWAAANGIPLQIQYTIPVEQYGLDPNGEAVLQSAVGQRRHRDLGQHHGLRLLHRQRGRGEHGPGGASTRPRTPTPSCSPSSRA